MKTYYIKPGYQCNLKPAVYQNSVEAALIYQLDVYRYAARLIEQQHITTVLDVGCGFGLKLREFISPTGAAIVGVDGPIPIDYCQKHLTFGRWFVDDVENPRADLGQYFDLIICADVIEHLIDPDTLFHYFRRWSHGTTRLVISTPERDLRRGLDHMGPPNNGAHVREWNQNEFSLYLTSHNLLIEDHCIVDLREGMKTCQLALCSWNRNQ